MIHSQFNRLKDGRFGRSIAEVCLRRFQYSEFNDDALDNANLLRGAGLPAENPAVVDCLKAFDEILAGAPDPTNRATHYHDKSISPPSWTQKQPDGRQATVALTTPKFIFYSNVP